MEELESVAVFPEELKKLNDSLNKVNELNVVRTKLTTEMADSSNLIKTLVIKAENARTISEMYATLFHITHCSSQTMKKIYHNLFELNQDLVNEYTKRAINFEVLLSSLKEVNQTVQRAARLRVGSVKQRVINLCRAAIKANNVQSLFQIIKFGKEE